MRLIKLRDTGDTILEVLIALTVVASMLGAAYVTTNRSLNNNRQAQERGEALKLAEGQLERLKAIVITGSTDPFTVAPTFCIDSNNDIVAATTAACTVDTGAADYYVVVERQSSYNFSIAASWDRAGGNGQDVINMDYRLRPVDTNFATASPDPPPAPAPPPPPPPTPPTPPSGTLSCTTQGPSSISLSYSFANSGSAYLYRGSTQLRQVTSSPGSFTDDGLSANTGYVYYLRHGNSASSTALGTAACTTASLATGTISCSYGPFVGMSISYSYSNASSPSVWRGGTYIHNAAGSPGAYLDSDSSVMGTGGDITYYLRNGQAGGSTALSSATCRSEVIDVPPGIINWNT